MRAHKFHMLPWPIDTYPIWSATPSNMNNAYKETLAGHCRDMV